MTFQKRTRLAEAAEPRAVHGRARECCAKRTGACTRRRLGAVATALVLLAAGCKGPAPVDLGTERPTAQWACGPGADGGWDCTRNAAAADVAERSSTGALPPARTPRRANDALAYRPAQPTRLLDLPGSYYALQLAVRDSQAGLDAFVRAQGLTGLPQVRVARRGRVAHVLLAGVYRDRDAAERARDSFPKRLGSMRPWVRRLRSLQEAMLRADALSGSGAAHTARIGGEQSR